MNQCKAPKPEGFLPQPLPSPGSDRGRGGPGGTWGRRGDLTDRGGPRRGLGRCSEVAVVETEGASVGARAWTKAALVEEDGAALVGPLDL